MKHKVPKIDLNLKL